MDELETLKRRLAREREARKEVEILWKKKNLELHQFNRELLAGKQELELQISKYNDVLKGLEERLAFEVRKRKELEKREGKYRNHLDKLLKKSKEELRQKNIQVQEKLNLQVAALESAADAIVITNREGSIIWVNSAFSALTGYTIQETIGQNPRILQSGFHDPTLYADIWEIILSGKVWQGELVNRRKDGSMYTEEMTITPVMNKEGKLTHFVAIKRDITERKRVEKELNQAKEIAEAATRAKSEFLANMSHEIRTPLNGVIGMLNLLEKETLVGEQRDFVEMALNSAESLLGIINDILDFSKIEAGKLVIESRPFDLEMEINRLAEVFSQKVRERGVELIIRYDVLAPYYVIGDNIRIRQIINNLVANAIKFTSKGHIFINIDCENINENEARLCIRVEDTGIGISQEQLEYIFEHFTQADASTTRKYGGTGLGLAITKQLVQMMGGKIFVSSTLGEGTTFCFTLTLPLDKKTDQATFDTESVQSCRMLAVDDNAISRRIFDEYLNSWNIRHSVFTSGREVLKAMKEAVQTGDPFDVAILDYFMPEMDGMELARIIKSDPSLKDTILVMVTSLGKQGDTKRMEEAGFAAYLSKPVNRRELYGTLSSLLERKKKDSNLKSIMTRHTLDDQTFIKDVREEEPVQLELKTLLVEDHPVNQRLAKALLEKLGCKVDVAENGKVAVDMVLKGSYDVVFMDVQMPVMGGYAATKAIRALEGNVSRIPIIAMTASAMEGDREKCLNAGMDDYISKPVKKDQIRKTLSNIVSLNNGLSKITLSGAVFNYEEALSLYEGDEDLLQSLAIEFIDRAMKDLKQIKLAIESKDADQVQAMAHALTGGASFIGAERVRQIVSSMELAGHEKDLSQAAELLPDLNTELTRLHETILKFHWNS